MIDPIAALKVLGSNGTTAAIPIVMMFAMFTPKSEYIQHVADSQSGTILTLVAQAAQEPPGGYKQSLCNALHQELGFLCQNAPTHSMCIDRMSYLNKAGC